jgi:hypothetical protein
MHLLAFTKGAPLEVILNHHKGIIKGVPQSFYVRLIPHERKKKQH